MNRERYTDLKDKLDKFDALAEQLKSMHEFRTVLLQCISITVRDINTKEPTHLSFLGNPRLRKMIIHAIDERIEEANKEIEEL